MTASDDGPDELFVAFGGLNMDESDICVTSLRCSGSLF